MYGFQPTLPVRGATATVGAPSRRWWNFNPRSPCGERLEEPAPEPEVEEFQPTLPVRGATEHGAYDGRHDHISTHAPRAGSDSEKEKRA